MDQTQRETNKKILDRIASDPTFREELLDDPKGAMERAGFKWEGDDVAGYGLNSLASILPINTVSTPGGVIDPMPGNSLGTPGSVNQDSLGENTVSTQFPDPTQTPPDGGR